MTLIRWTEPHFKTSLPKKARVQWDRTQSTVVRTRSGGICEACGEARAVHVHHKLNGHGVRGRGESALAVNKLALCAECHNKAHGPKGRVASVQFGGAFLPP